MRYTNEHIYILIHRQLQKTSTCDKTKQKQVHVCTTNIYYLLNMTDNLKIKKKVDFNFDIATLFLSVSPSKNQNNWEISKYK